jgi:arsenite methyltransferase
VWHSTDPDRMRRILLTWEQHLADPFLPRTLGRHLRRAGFDVAPARVVPLLNVGYDAANYSSGLISMVARFVAGRDGWTAADVDGWAEDLHTLGPDYFFSLNRYVFCTTKPR